MIIKGSRNFLVKHSRSSFALSGRINRYSSYSVIRSVVPVRFTVTPWRFIFYTFNVSPILPQFPLACGSSSWKRLHAFYVVRTRVRLDGLKGPNKSLEIPGVTSARRAATCDTRPRSCGNNVALRSFLRAYKVHLYVHMYMRRIIVVVRACRAPIPETRAEHVRGGFNDGNK